MPTTTPRLTLEYLDPATLTPQERNPRQHPPEQSAALAGSLDTVGWAGAALLNKRTGRLVDGHLRRAEAIERGETMPTLVGDWSEEQERFILRTLDPIAAMAEENEGLLEALNARIAADVEAGLLEIGEGLAGLLATATGGLLPDVDPDELPPADEVEPRCKSGEVWECGRHRVMCGDSMKAEDVARLMGGERARMIWTDPPYGVGYQDNESIESLRARNRRTDGKVVGNDSLSASDTEALVRDGLASFASHCCEGAGLYVACPPGTLLPHYIAAVASSGFQFRHSLVWVKDQFVFGRADYHYRHEMVLYGWLEGTHYFRKDRTQDSVFEIERPRTSEDHPTMKPVKLVSSMIENSSEVGDLVADPFLGSGTTIIAAEQLNRRAFGMEIEPRYVDIALARYERATGREARRVEA